jgi:hypothetical protein
MRLLVIITTACLGVIPVAIALGYADDAALVQASSLILFIGFTGFIVAGGAWWILCLVEILRAPEPQWQAAGQSRLVYVLLLLFLSLLGALLYYLIARPALAAVQAGHSSAV